VRYSLFSSHLVLQTVWLQAYVPHRYTVTVIDASFRRNESTTSATIEVRVP